MPDIVIPLLVLFGVVGIYILMSVINTKTDAPVEIELIDCENCVNGSCPIRKQNFAVRKEDKDKRCHYMPANIVKK